MTNLLHRAFEQARLLSNEEQDALALMLLDELETGGNWLAAAAGLFDDQWASRDLDDDWGHATSGAVDG